MSILSRRPNTTHHLALFCLRLLNIIATTYFIPNPVGVTNLTIATKSEPIPISGMPFTIWFQLDFDPPSIRRCRSYSHITARSRSRSFLIPALVQPTRPEFTNNPRHR
jgi:hypothetical protein